MKKRLDQLLIDKGLVESKTKAQALIMAGQVFADGHRVDKSGTKLDEKTDICVKDLFPYVSRGALKLEKAYKEFGLNFTDKVVCDIGSSTGGFTDFALQYGAKHVFAVDVGTGQLAQKIREDDRVTVMEKTDFRDVLYRPTYSSVISTTPSVISTTPSVISTEAEKSASKRSLDLARDGKQISVIADHIDMFVCDVSFISLKKIIPKIKEVVISQSVISTKPESERRDPSGNTKRFLQQGRNDNEEKSELVLLIKPQFEAGVKEVSRGKGVIRDEALRKEIVEDIKAFATEQGFEVIGITESPITGAKGNVEYLLFLK